MTIKAGGDYEDRGHDLTREALRNLAEYTVDMERSVETRQWVRRRVGCTQDMLNTLLQASLSLLYLLEYSQKAQNAFGLIPDQIR